MKTVIYIGNDSIQLLKGRIKKKELLAKENRFLQLPQGTVVNGVITNPVALEDGLRQLEVRGKVTLLIDSSNIVTKLLEVPKMNKKQIASLVEKEFALGDVNSEMIYGSSLIDRTKGQLLCFGCPKSIIVGFLKVFEAVNIKIACIDSLVNCLVKYSLGNADFNKAESGWLMNLILGENMVSVLFQDGQFVLTNRNRIFAEPETGGYPGEIYGKLSSMVQFNQAQKAKYPITASYYLGLTQVDLQGLQRWIELNEANIQTEQLHLLAEDEHPFAALGLIRFKEDLNLLDSYRTAGKPARSLGADGIKILVAAMSIALIGGGWYSIYSKNQLYREELKGINQYIAESAPEYDRYNRYTSYHSRLSSYKQALSESSWESWRYKIIDQQKVSMALEVGFMTELSTASFDMVTRSLSISGISASEYDVVDYAKYLDECGLFEAVDYTGYQGKEGEYTFQISAVIKER